MGCVFGTHSKNKPQPSKGHGRKEPPHEVGFQLLATSQIKFLSAARTNYNHGAPVVDFPAVLSDREMEIPEAQKGELNKFVPAYGLGFTNLGTSILCQGVLGNWKGWNLEAKAKASGASQLEVKDLEEFVPDFIRSFGLPMRV